MISIIIFFLFPFLLILLPVFLYRTYNSFMVSVWYRLAFSKAGLKMATILLAIVVILFNLTYAAVFHRDFGFKQIMYVKFNNVKVFS